MNKQNNPNQNENKIEKNVYVLDMFPYPSGDGLHVGHPKGYVATDIYSRMKKMQGFNVIHPMGWDAFGLPAEQYAIKNKVHPKVAVEKNIANFKSQLNNINFDYDWDREISTTDPKFYKWTQWIFKQLYKKGLAYESFEPINWCPSCKTGLANEDLEGNACERCGTVVEKKPLRQWNLAITKYADRLIDDLDTLTTWPEHVKTAQRNWIGRSEGSEVDFKIIGGDKDISFTENNNTGMVGYGTNISMNTSNSFESEFTIFTTRADTLFGCTYTVLAPEHKLVRELLEDKDGENILQNKEEVRKYLDVVKSKNDIERSAEGKEKTGVRLEGVVAINPANQKEVPVYIADYVLASYGTGAIMAVPAYDERDKEFAEKYNIEILSIKEKDTDEERKRITDLVNGRLVKKYKLKEWVFARQRYWGEPFPVVYATDENGERDRNAAPIMVADSELPVLLPEVESYEPTGTGESPLANIKSFTDVYGYVNEDGEFVSDPSLGEGGQRPEGVKLFKRETNTMPQWAGSSWYWLRFLDPNNDNFLIDPKIEKAWPQVDVYVGGDHATRHLIYARFWHKFLYDIGIVSHIEPFKRLEFLGFILAEDGSKMSKSKGNTINPDTVVAEYGSDTFRMYEMFIAPFEATAVWSTSSIRGVKKFLDRVEKLKIKLDTTPSLGEGTEGGRGNLEIILNQTIKKVGEDIENFKFNTAVSQMMICMNAFEEVITNGGEISKKDFDKFLTILAPFAPTLCADYLKTEWPAYNENKLQSNTVKIALQISGKLRDTFDMTLNAEDSEVISMVKNLEAYKKYTENLEPKKIIVVKNKIVNVVV